MEFALLPHAALWNVLTFCDTSRSLRATCATLREVFLHGPFVTCRSPPAPMILNVVDALAPRATFLERVTLSSCTITGVEVVGLLRECKALHALWILDLPKSCKGIDFSCVSSHPSCKDVVCISESLRHIKITNCLVFSLGFMAAKCPNIATLEVANCPDFSDDDLEQLIPTLKAKLGRLALTNCPGIHDLGLECVAVNAAPTLVHLDLRGCSDVSDTGVRAIASRLHRIRTLELAGCRRVTTTGVLDALQRQPSLQSFGCSLFEDAVLASFRRPGTLLSSGASSGAGTGTTMPLCLSSLRTIDISQCHFSDASFPLLVDLCPVLHSLTLRWLPSITERGVLAACASLRAHLRTLRVEKCRRVSIALEVTVRREYETIAVTVVPM